MIVAVVQTLTAWTTTVLVNGHGLTLASASSLFGTMVLAGAPLGHLGGGVLLDSLRRHIGARSLDLLIAGSLAVSFPAVTLFGLALRFDLALVGLTAATFLLGLGVPGCLAGIQALPPHALRTRVRPCIWPASPRPVFGLGPPLVGALCDGLGGSAWIGEAITVVAAGATLIGMAAIVAQFNLGIARRARSQVRSSSAAL